MTSRGSCAEIGGNCKVVDALKIEIGQGALGETERVRFSSGFRLARMYASSRFALCYRIRILQLRQETL